MRSQIFLILIMLIIVNSSIAQIRATTESGNKVLLFDDGTWKYDEQSVNTEEKAVITAGGLVTIKIDSSKEVSTKPSEIFYGPSPRLVKFFGKSGGNIRCKVGSSNNFGTIKLHFTWEFPITDGNRYFGWFKEGTKVTFTMVNDEKVELFYGNENSFERFEKFNYSVSYNISEPLTKGHLAILSSHPIDKMELSWKNRSEEYDLDGTRFLMDVLPEVF